MKEWEKILGVNIYSNISSSICASLIVDFPLQTNDWVLLVSSECVSILVVELCWCMVLVVVSVVLGSI